MIHKTRIVLPALLLSLLVLTAAYAANIDAADKYAWATNAGWLNFNPSHGGGVTVYSDHLEGYLWAENVGWIRLGTHTGGGTHTYTNADQNSYGVNNDGVGNLSGYAWGTNVGWINFDPSHGGVTIDPATGQFDGYAWGENVGWIDFRGTAADSTPYGVTTGHYPTAVELATFRATAAVDGSAILLEWETASELDLLGFHVLRSDSPEGEKLQLNAALILSQNPGGPVGAAYAWPDESAAPGVTSFYWLETVDVHGGATLHGPVTAALPPTKSYRVYLPFVNR